MSLYEFEEREFEPDEELDEEAVLEFEIDEEEVSEDDENWGA